MVYHGIQLKMMYKIFFKVDLINYSFCLSKHKQILGCKIRQTQFITNDQGRSTGECFVVLETKEDIDIAKNFYKKMMGTRK